MNHSLSLTQGGARSSLALGYYLIVLTGLQFGSLRSRIRRTVKGNDERHAPVLQFQIDVVAAHSLARR